MNPTRRKALIRARAKCRQGDATTKRARKHERATPTKKMLDLTAALKAARDQAVGNVRIYDERIGGTKDGGPMIWDGTQWL